MRHDNRNSLEWNMKQREINNVCFFSFLPNDFTFGLQQPYVRLLKYLESLVAWLFHDADKEKKRF